MKPVIESAKTNEATETGEVIISDPTKDDVVDDSERKPPIQMIRLLRGDRNERIGYFYASVLGPEGDIGIGYSFCRAGDRFDGQHGIGMACDRAIRHASKKRFQIRAKSAYDFKPKSGCMVIPDKVIDNGFYAFLRRCRRIYGFDQMPTWALLLGSYLCPPHLGSVELLLWTQTPEDK